MAGNRDNGNYIELLLPPIEGRKEACTALRALRALPRGWHGPLAVRTDVQHWDVTVPREYLVPGAALIAMLREALSVEWIQKAACRRQYLYQWFSYFLGR
jgi:hypothetical protein